MIIVSLVFSGAKLRNIIEMEALFAPAMSLKIGHTVFRRVGCRVPEPMTHKVVGQELLLHEMLGIVVETLGKNASIALPSFQWSWATLALLGV